MEESFGGATSRLGPTLVNFLFGSARVSVDETCGWVVAVELFVASCLCFHVMLDLVVVGGRFWCSVGTESVPLSLLLVPRFHERLLFLLLFLEEA